MLPRRRRSDAPDAINNSHRHKNIASEANAAAERGSIAPSASPVSHNFSYESSGINGTTSDIIRTYPRETRTVSICSQDYFKTSNTDLY
jgi:hypothetical protein